MWGGRKKADLPMVIAEPGSPVGCSKQCLQGTCQIHKEVTHEKKPGRTKV